MNKANAGRNAIEDLERRVEAFLAKEDAISKDWKLSVGSECGDYGGQIDYHLEGVKDNNDNWVYRLDDDYGTGNEVGRNAEFIVAV